jgi:hypothetical protein
VSASRRTPSGTPSPRRRATRRLTLAVAATAAVALVGVPSALGSAWLPWSPASSVGSAATAEATPIKNVPADEPDKGLVHRGLKPAKKGSACVGLYEVVATGACSHGPDQVPAGLKVKSDVKPITAPAKAQELPALVAVAPSDAQITTEEGGALAADASAAVLPEAAAAAAAPAVGPNGVVCEGDGQSGKRVQVLYVRESTTASRFSTYLGSFQKWAAGVEAIYDSSAKETGGSRHLRYVTTADCQVDVREVEIPAGKLSDFGTGNSEIAKLGYNRTDRKYMIFAESKVYCGIGSFRPDDQPGAANANNGGGRSTSYGRSDTGCWSASVAAHELGHNLGAVSNNAPNSSKAGHCIDDYDVMCYQDGGPLEVKIVCTNRKVAELILDCNHDDYYSTNPKAGSFLATHWNVANNQFLIAGDPSGTPDPNPTPTVTPTSVPPTKPSPTVTPTTPTPTPTTPKPPTPTATKPSPTVTPTTPTPTPTTPTPTDPTPTVTPTGSLATLTVSGVTATGARLSWPPAASGSSYGVVVNGRTLGTVRSAGVSLAGLRPGTSYQAQITLRGAPYTEIATISTPAAAVPAAGTWFSLNNALTGTAADLYGARTADRTPLVLQSGNDSANQRWQLQAVGTNGFRIQSKASGKCVTALGKAVAGAPLTQKACADAQLWNVTRTDAGLSLRTVQGELVAGLSTGRFAGQRMLVLQRPTGDLQQAWTATSA